MQFDFAAADWSDDDSSPFDQCDTSSSSSSCSSGHCDDSTAMLRSPTSIRFAQEDEVFDIPHVNDFSDEHKKAGWYQPHEFRAMRMLAAHVAENGATGLLDSDDCDLRGLEFRSLEGGMKRSLHKREAYAAVLGAQERLWEEGHYHPCPDTLAAAYKVVAIKCQGLALFRGIKDAQDISEYVRNNTIQYNNTTQSVETESAPDSSTTSEPSQTVSAEEATARACKSIDEEASCYRRIAVLEDIKVLSGVSGVDLCYSPAAA